MAEIEWKGIIWSSAYGNYSYKELLTILKGFGSMEIIAFEKPWIYRGIASIALNPQGGRDLTLYYLEAIGPKRRGTGRQALKELREIFKGSIVVQDPGEILCSEYSIVESLFFWIKMFQEGLIDELDSDEVLLKQGMTEEELKKIEDIVRIRLQKIKNERKNIQSQGQSS
ncbi:MAG: hypothetical protein WHS38_00700 [Thermodesulforhabdaceae bacterium]